MEFLTNLFVTPSIVQSIVVLTLTIFMGLWLGEHAKIKSFTLGVTWILFVGIILSHFGLRIMPEVAGFAKDFGLILFVYSIGLQVGPSFFSSFGKGGLKLNGFAAAIVVTGVLVTILISVITKQDLPTMVGVMSGAITNTPSLGAAEQAYTDITGTLHPALATGYAVAYPLGVLGIIFSLLLVKWFFRINTDKEAADVRKRNAANNKEPMLCDVLINNPQIVNMTIQHLHHTLNIPMVVSRVIRPDKSEIVPQSDTTISVGDTLRILTDIDHIDSLALIGAAKEHKKADTEYSASNLVSKKIVVTRPEWNGKQIRSLGVNNQYHVTITRINRAGINLIATSDLRLQLGDRITVVGDQNDVKKVTDLFGNELKKLDVPNLIPIFFGILLGVFVGMLPITFPGMKVPFKLGLAGGTLIVAILIGRFGPSHHMVTFATNSANRMIREIGLALFLAAVGLGAGEKFVSTLMDGGWWWILYGVIITIVPLLIIGVIARKWGKLDYFTLMGLMAGSTTDPPALAFATETSEGLDNANVAYATVYPLTMFLRVMAAQLLIIFFCV